MTTKQQKFKSNNLSELKSERFFLVLVLILLKFFSSGNKICSNNERERESLEAAMSDGCTGIAKLDHCNWKILALEKLALLQHEICGLIWATAVETHLSNCDGESEGYSIFGRTGYSESCFEFVLQRESSLSDEHVKCSVSGRCSYLYPVSFFGHMHPPQESVHKHCGTDGIRPWPRD